VAPDVTEPKPNADIVVLDDLTPGVWPGQNLLAIHTMNTNWFTSVGSVDGPTIVDWKSTHPLLRFVSFDNVAVAKALAVKTPTWAVAVADSPQTPLILAGELARQRIAWLGFDTLESTWPLRVSFPIFIANAVDWLNPASIQASQLLVKAGEPFRHALSDPVTSAEVTFPDGSRKSLSLDPNAQELVFGDTANQGVYHLAIGTNQLVFCVDLLDSAESDTHPRAELNFGKFGDVAATTTRRANLEIWRWIAALGLAVLLFEWWYYHRRTA